MARAGSAPALSPPAPTRAVIFDFDGVIADTEWLHSETFRQVLAEDGIHIETQDHGERFLGINDRAAFLKAFAEAGRSLSAADVEALVARKSSAFTRRLPDIRPFPGAVALVNNLAGRVRLAIASGGRGPEIEAILRAHGLRERFEAVLSSDDVERSKPAPDSYLAALAALRRTASSGQGLDARECVAIEDSLHGIQAARAAGLRCLAVAHTFPRALLSAADRVEESIAMVSASSLLDWEPGR